MKDESGTAWAKWPLFGAVGAGRRDEVPDSPGSYEYALTPSGQAEQDSARKASRDTLDEEAADGAGPE